MSLLAGYYLREADSAGADSATRTEILHLLGALSGARLHTVQSGRAFAAIADLGCFDSPGFSSQPGVSHLAAAGHPYLRGASGSRSAHAEALRLRFDAGGAPALAQADGSWCGVHYGELTGRLTLAADKLGLRPLYYWESGSLVVFASALWILERLSTVEKVLDFQGATESVCFGFPLARRSAYRHIRRLYSGEYVQLDGSTLASHRHTRLEHTPESTQPAGELAREAATAFGGAVRLRMADHQAAIAFLSGGLDSRLVVAALRQQGRQVATYNFSLQETLDSILAARFAAAAQTTHFSGEWLIGSHVIDSLALAWRSQRPDFAVENPRQVWSGDGGSVGLGGVYVTPEIERHLGGGRIAEALHCYVRNAGALLPARLYGRRVRSAAAVLPHLGVQEEFSTLAASLPSLRAFFFFLLFNDQRHHLSGFYESIHEHGYELHLPFFDGAFLETVARVPTRQMLYHRFYSHVLAEFPPSTVSVPWQAYVDHDPCPLPMPEGAVKQWTGGFRTLVNAQKRKRLLEALPVIEANRPPGFFNGLYLRTALAFYKAGFPRYDFAVQTAAGYARLLAVSGGRYAV